MKSFLKAVWQLTSSTTFTTRQTPNKLSLLSLLWHSARMCLCHRGDLKMTVRQDRQTRRPPLAGGWSVRGAEGSVVR